jgi:hypothetical protein
MACVISAAGNVCAVCEDIKEDQRDKELYKTMQETWYTDFVAGTHTEKFSNCDIGKVKVSPTHLEDCMACTEGHQCQPCQWRTTFFDYPCMEEVRAPDASTRRYSIVKHRLAKKGNLAKLFHCSRTRKMKIPYMPNCNLCMFWDSSYHSEGVNCCSACGARNPRVVFKTDL